jgi:hypothetical protein
MVASLPQDALFGRADVRMDALQKCKGATMQIIICGIINIFIANAPLGSCINTFGVTRLADVCAITESD